MGSSDRITLPTDLQEFARASERALQVAAARGDAIGPEAVPWVVATNDELIAMPLNERHGFVLSLVDGRSTVDAISDVSGLARAEVTNLIAQLVQLGALSLRTR